MYMFDNFGVNLKLYNHLYHEVTFSKYTFSKCLTVHNGRFLTV